MPTGGKIKRYRKLRGMYQGELAEKAGLTEGAIRHYESGARTPKPSQVLVSMYFSPFGTAVEILDRFGLGD